MGLQSSRQCKLTALKMGLDSIEQFERPPDTPVEHMMQNAETAVFQAKMQDWHTQCLTFTHSQVWKAASWEVFPLRQCFKVRIFHLDLNDQIGSLSRALSSMSSDFRLVTEEAPIYEDEPGSGVVFEVVRFKFHDCCVFRDR